MNNKGFTLIELLATIMLLAIIMSVTTISIINIVGSSKRKSYELLVEDIKIAAQGYFEECAGSSLIETNIDCDLDDDGDNDAINEKKMNFSLKYLLDYGFLKGADEEGEKKVIDPKTNKNINNCEIEITKEVDSDYNVTYTIESNSTNDTETDDDGNTIECPTTADYTSNN